MIPTSEALHLIGVAPLIEAAVSDIAGPEAGHAAALIVIEHIAAAVKQDGKPTAPAYVTDAYRAKALECSKELQALRAQQAEVRRQMRLPQDAEWGEMLTILQSLTARIKP